MSKLKQIKYIIKNIVAIFIVAMFFSCANTSGEVRDFLADKNLPIGISREVYNVYTDSGRVTSKLKTPLLLNFSNREKHPYAEFPDGVKVISFDKKNDSTVVVGDYAIIYNETNISEIRGNVVITNNSQNKILTTDQLFWDQKTKYFYTEKPFVLYSLLDTIYGEGLDASQDLSKFTAKRNRGVLNLKED